MASMTSSVRAFIEENGRTYHKYKEGGKYSCLMTYLMCTKASANQPQHTIYPTMRRSSNA
jgi:hypothetical protein